MRNELNDSHVTRLLRGLSETIGEETFAKSIEVIPLGKEQRNMEAHI